MNINFVNLKYFILKMYLFVLRKVYVLNWSPQFHWSKADLYIDQISGIFEGQIAAA